GGFAWDAMRQASREVFDLPKVATAFAHGACAPLGPGRPLLWGSYHPSPLNTNTGKLTLPMLTDLLGRIRGSFEGPGTARHPGSPG
ncbi:MAG TPA: uracil-DNA glycosylase, partial [Thermoplasmata archaeon]|nr:uracil-DNA glycosylase [Thermoplasmata archaeon]